jgi:hypothetical protein
MGRLTSSLGRSMHALEMLSLWRSDSHMLTRPDLQRGNAYLVPSHPWLHNLGTPLQHLQLQGFNVDWIPFGIYNLSCLSIELCRTGSCSTWEDIFETLSQMENLHTLTLDRSLPAVHFSLSGVRYKLSSLRNLHICDASLQFASFLQHVSMPQIDYMQLSLEEWPGTDSTKAVLFNALSSHVVSLTPSLSILDYSAESSLHYQSDSDGMRRTVLNVDFFPSNAELLGEQCALQSLSCWLSRKCPDSPVHC